MVIPARASTTTAVFISLPTATTPTTHPRRYMAPPMQFLVLFALLLSSGCSTAAVTAAKIGHQRPAAFVLRRSSSTTASRLKTTCRAAADSSNEHQNSSNNHLPPGQGLYRPFLDHAWERLQKQQDLQPVTPTNPTFRSKTAPAKGMPPGSVVHMETRALAGKSANDDENASPIQYARAALLETLKPGGDGVANDDDDDDDEVIHTAGIQVLNLVIFPTQPHWPVWGADFVSLPGDKHLLLLDAQPMTSANNKKYESPFEQWYETNVVATGSFPWGGDMPEAVQPFVSGKALWTRLGAAADPDPDQQSVAPIPLIQQELLSVFSQHLNVYLELLATLQADEAENEPVENAREAYVKYRLENDPARPMLRSLYGEEWSEQVLREVLFPPL